MADTKTETTKAVQTRTAAAELRELLAAVPAGHWALYEDLIVHDGSTESAILTDARPGMDALVLSGEWWGEGLAAVRLLVALHAAAEPLASWLEEVADEAVRHEAQGMGNSQDEVIHGPCLATARAIKGGAS